MENILIGIATFLVSAVIFTFIGMYIRKKIAESKMESAENEAKKIIERANIDAENKKKEEIFKAKEEIMNARNELDQEIKERRGEVQKQESRIIQKEENLEKRSENFEKKERELEREERELKNKEKEIEDIKAEQAEVLQKVAGLTKEEAKKQLLNSVEQEITAEKAALIRDLEQKAKEEAKKNAPCIVFIDEIDAVARRRGTGMGGGHDEREQTLNQMLVEMDGFGVNQGIIVMAATNRVDILDPAIMRPGRFDRKIVVGRPDVAGREEILQVHAKNKPLGDDVDLKQIAQTTAGFTGADLENLLNEAAILAAKESRAYIQQADIQKAFIKVGIGAEKHSRVISEKEKKITAYHESGHALLFHLLPDVGPVHTVSIIPTGAGAAGYTMPLPEKDEMFNSRGRMLQEIVVDLGGRVAEELVFDDITTGASQDIKQATKMARDMVTRYGMSENIGLICYKDDDDEVFIGRDLAHAHSYSEGIASAIDVEVKRIIDESYEKAKTIIAEHRDVLDRCAALLLEKEKITREEFEALFEA